MVVVSSEHDRHILCQWSPNRRAAAQVRPKLQLMLHNSFTEVGTVLPGGQSVDSIVANFINLLGKKDATNLEPLDFQAMAATTHKFVARNSTDDVANHPALSSMFACLCKCGEWDDSCPFPCHMDKRMAPEQPPTLSDLVFVTAEVLFNIVPAEVIYMVADGMVQLANLKDIQSKMKQEHFTVIFIIHTLASAPAQVSKARIQQLTRSVYLLTRC